MNFLQGTVDTTGEGWAQVSVAHGACSVQVPVERAIESGAPATLGIRPEHLLDAGAAVAGALPIEVDITEHLGGVSYVYAHAPDGTRLSIERKGVADVRRGSALHVELDPGACHLFDAGGQRI